MSKTKLMRLQILGIDEYGKPTKKLSNLKIETDSKLKERHQESLLTKYVEDDVQKEL